MTGNRSKSWVEAFTGDIEDPNVLAEMLADAKSENNKSKEDKLIKEINRYRGKTKPKPKRKPVKCSCKKK